MNNTQKTKTERPKKSMFHANPLMNRYMKNAAADAETEENCASYGGITVKTGYFLLMTVVGIVTYLMLDRSGIFGSEYIEGLKYEGFEFRITLIQLLVLSGVAVGTIVSQLIAAFVPKTIPVTGTLYCLGQGFALSCLIFTILGASGNEYLGLLALAITVVVVLTMAILYSTGLIKVTAKFRMIMLSICFGMIGISLVTLICAFIPGVNVFVGSILANPFVSIGISLLSVVLATLFLVSEFAEMDYAVSQKLPVKYEWQVAFGLSFTILWLYIKILDIVIQIAGGGRR